LARKGLPKSAPRSGVPYMPGYDMMFAKGRRSLPWTWAAERLSKAQNYFLVTVRPDGRPHAMPVWGLWLEDAFYFSTGRRSRKSRNLAANPNCVVCPESASEAVILEGNALEVAGSSLPRKFNSAYEKKYNWKIEGNEGPFYEVQPQVVFGFDENAGSNPTRWIFRTP